MLAFACRCTYRGCKVIHIQLRCRGDSMETPRHAGHTKEICKNNGAPICAAVGIRESDDDNRETFYDLCLQPLPNCTQASAIVWEDRFGKVVCAKCVPKTTLKACVQFGKGCKYLCLMIIMVQCVNPEDRLDRSGTKSPRQQK